MKDIQILPWPTVYIMVGLPGSGKSTWAKKECEKRDAVIVSRDGIRSMLTGRKERMVGDNDFERMVTQIEREVVAEAIRAKKNVILDATNTRIKLTVKNMDEIASSVLRPFGPFPNIIPVVMDTPLDECLLRNARRRFPVPSEVLHRMQERLDKELVR